MHADAKGGLAGVSWGCSVFLLDSCALIISHGLCETPVCQHALGVLELLVIVSLECSFQQELLEAQILLMSSVDEWLGYSFAL